MDIKLSPSVISLIKSKDEKDIERLVNDLLFLYLHGDLIRPMQIIRRFKVPTVYMRETETFDAQTHEFKGTVMSESLWVPGEELRDLLFKYDEIVILNSPRKTGIRRKKAKLKSTRKKLS